MKTLTNWEEKYQNKNICSKLTSLIVQITRPKNLYIGRNCTDKELYSQSCGSSQEFPVLQSQMILEELPDNNQLFSAVQSKSEQPNSRNWRLKTAAKQRTKIIKRVMLSKYLISLKKKEKIERESFVSKTIFRFISLITYNSILNHCMFVILVGCNHFTARGYYIPHLNQLEF